MENNSFGQVLSFDGKLFIPAAGEGFNGADILDKACIFQTPKHELSPCG